MQTTKAFEHSKVENQVKEHPELDLDVFGPGYGEKKDKWQK